MDLTQTLVSYTHSAFDRSPESFIAFRARHASDAYRYTVRDRVLTGYLGNEPLFFANLADHTLDSLVRFISAQLIALLEPRADADGDELYLRNARHANAMAQRLRAGVEAGLADGSITGVSFSQPTEANGVFATLPDGIADELRQAFRFYDWDVAKNVVRWMCSFDTTEDDVDAFVADIARLT